MKCPSCNDQMKEVPEKSAVSHNGGHGKDLKQYDRKVYRCFTDDAWVQIELPVDNS